MKQYSISNLTSKRLSMVRFMLSLKSTLTNSKYFYFVSLILKLMSIIIISGNFLLNPTNEYIYQISVELRSITVFGLFAKGITYQIYSWLSYIFFSLELIVVFYIFKFYRNTKRKHNYYDSEIGSIQLKLISIFFHFFLLISQHLLEFFSFAIVMRFNFRSPDYPLFNSETNNLDIILLLCNCFSLIFVNVFQYFSYFLLNEPFFETNFPINFRYSKLSLSLFIFIINLQCFHYVELIILKEASLFMYKSILFAVILLFLIIIYLHTYRLFNFLNLFSQFISFVLVYSFFSLVLETILSTTDEEVTNLQQFVFIIWCKIMLTISFMILNSFITEKVFMEKSKNTLFKQYNSGVSNNELETFYYVINLLLNMKISKTKDTSVLLNLIIAHKMICDVDYCKCNLINNFKNYNLTLEINFILEIMFSNVTLSKTHGINLLFAEYLCYLKNSTLFSYAILNTFINKNLKDDSIDLFQLCLLNIKKVRKCEEELKTNHEYVTFKKVYDDTKIIKVMCNKILKFIENFETLLSCKEKMDNTLKVDNTNSEFDSRFFSEDLSKVVSSCKKYRRNYRQIKSYIKKEFEVKKCKSVEVSYKLHIFFQLFNKKLPKSFALMLYINTDYMPNSSSYFNKLLDDYLSGDKAPMNIIIEINNTFKIKYISYHLCEILGYSHSKLIGNDIHTIFPIQLREYHKKVLLHYFLIKRQMYFFKKTFAFTSSHNIVPINLQVSTLPNLSRNLKAIVSANIIKKFEKRSFYFVVSENYDLIALSDNFETFYSINYELIEKLGINILKLFEINNLIPKKFKFQLEMINSIREEKQMVSLYSLSNYVFNLNFMDAYNIANNANLQNNNQNNQIVGKTKNVFNRVMERENKEKLNRDKVSTLTNYKHSISRNGESEIDNSITNLRKNSEIPVDGELSNISRLALFTSKYKLNSNSVVNSSTKINTSHNQINNINKLIDKNRSSKANNKEFDFETSDSSFILDNNLNKKDSFTIYTNKKLVIQYLEKIKNKYLEADLGNNYFNKICDVIDKLRKIDDCLSKNFISNEYFKIKVEFRKMNDSPFFIINAKEKFKSNKTAKNPAAITFVQEGSRIKTDSNSINNRSENSLIGNLDVKEANQYTSLTNKVLRNEELLKFKKEEKLKRKERKREMKIMAIIKILLIINIILAVMIFLFKKWTLNTIELFFSITYFNYVQESSLQFLHSGIISLFLTVGNLTNLNGTFANSNGLSINYKELQALISERINLHRDHFSNLVSSITNSNENLKEIITIINENNNYNKTIIDWQNINSKETIFVANDYLSTNSKFISLEMDFSNLKYDIENVLFFQKFKFTPDSLQNSEHSSLIYYFNENVPNSFEQIYSKVNSSINSITRAFFVYWSNFCYLSEIISMLLSIFVFIWIYYILVIYDKSIFKLILSMFLNLRSGKRTHYKSNIEIQVIRYKLRSFKQLLYSFNKNTIKQMQNTNNDSDLISVGKNNKKYTILKTDNDQTLTNKRPLIQNNNSKITSGVGFNNISEIGINNTSGIGVNNTSGIGVNNTLGTGIGFNNNTLNFNQSYNILSNIVSTNNMNTNSNVLNINQLNDNNHSSLAIFQNRGKIIRNNRNKINTFNTTSTIVQKDFINKLKKNNRYDKLDQIEDIITCVNILTKTKHYQINSVKIAKILIITSFSLYILFLSSNIIASYLYISQSSETIELAKSLMKRYSILANVFNSMRLMMFENTLSRKTQYIRYMNETNDLNENYKYFVTKLDSKLPLTYSYTQLLNQELPNITNNPIKELICGNNSVCNKLLEIKNGYNSKGIDQAFQTIIQSLNNFHHDYINLILNNLPEFELMENMKNFLRNKEMENINIEIEYIFDKVNNLYLSLINDDITTYFSNVNQLNLTLGCLSIVFNLFTIVYIILGIFTRLKEYLAFISYTSEKFNRALFDI